MRFFPLAHAFAFVSSSINARRGIALARQGIGGFAALFLLLSFAFPARGQFRTLQLQPRIVEGGALDGATIKIRPHNATFFGAEHYVYRGVEYIEPDDLVRDSLNTLRIPERTVRLNATGLALISLAGGPSGLTIHSGRLLAPERFGLLNKNRSVEVTLAYNGSPIGNITSTTLVVDAKLLRDEFGKNPLGQDLSGSLTILAPQVTVSAASRDLIETHPPQSYTIWLETNPGETITITATSDNPAVEVSSGGAFGAAATLSFTGGTNGNYNTPQTMQLRAPADANTTNEPYVVIRHTAAAANSNNPYHGIRVPATQVKVTDAANLTRAQFDNSAYSVPESSGSATITVTKTGSDAATIAYATENGTATAGQDYTATSGTLNFGASETSKTFSVPILDDAAIEGNETFHVVLSIPAGATTPVALGSPSRVEATIMDDDTAQASFASAAASVGEAVGTANARVNFAPALASDITLSYALSGTAARGNDYGITGVTSNTGTLDVASGATSATIPVTITDDSVVEGSETIILTLQDGTGYSVGSPNGHTLTITDNDTAQASFASATASVGEAAGTANVTVNFDQALASGVTLAYGLSGGATRGDDYGIAGVTSNTGTLDVASGATNATISITITDDGVVEGSETIILTLRNGTGYNPGSSNQHTLTITDNDTPGVTANVTTLNVNEGGADGRYELRLDAEPVATVTITPSSSDAGAVTVSGALTFNSSNWQTPQAVAVTPVDDADADDEAVTITHAISGYGNLTSGPQIAVAVDDDETTVAPGTPGVDASTSALALDEGGGSGTYTLVLRTDPGGTVTVTPSSSDAGAVTVSGALTFDASDWETPQAVTVTPVGDADADDEAVTITHAVSGYGNIASGPQIAVTVDDDETPVTPPVNPGTPGVDASTNALALDEGGGSGTYTLVLRTNPGGAVTVTPSSSDAGAVTVSGPLAFDASNWETPQTVTVTPVGDADADDEAATITHAISGYGNLTTGPEIAVTVDDNDIVTAREEEIPTRFALKQNYPNPFNPLTTVEFSLDKAQHVRLAVYDLVGQEVRVLTDGVRPAGRYRIPFDASDLASGTYLYALRSEEEVAIKTMVLLK